MNYELLQAESDRIADIYQELLRDAEKYRRRFPDLSNDHIYNLHSRLLVRIASEYVMLPQARTFVVDDHNRKLLRFLLYYFNNCPLAEEVFPDRRYKLAKPLFLTGNSGTGKTLLMQIFAEYLRRTKNPNQFENLSVTQMVNYYTLHNNLDKYTYNEEQCSGFRVDPVNICLNDIGLQSKTFYGMDTKKLIDEFIHARYEIWTQYGGKRAHLTSNLNIAQLKKEFADGYGRIIDRFKSYNLLEVTGPSRR
ncbi:MAG: hypothetical protein ACI4AM_06445 [Muribaculaceae bacterium]